MSTPVSRRRLVKFIRKEPTYSSGFVFFLQSTRDVSLVFVFPSDLFIERFWMFLENIGGRQEAGRLSTSQIELLGLLRTVHYSTAQHNTKQHNTVHAKKTRIVLSYSTQYLVRPDYASATGRILGQYSFSLVAFGDSNGSVAPLNPPGFLEHTLMR